MGIAQPGHTPESGLRLVLLFNTLVEKTVEKQGSIVLSSLVRDVSTPCTELVAGTLV
jgi:hypothetical protein